MSHVPATVFAVNWIGIVFGIIVGAGLFLAGRWVYGRPSKLFPQWEDTNAGQVSLSKGAGAVLIFAGFFAATGVVISSIGRTNAWIGFLPFPVGLLGAILLRPHRAENSRSAAAN